MATINQNQLRRLDARRSALAAIDARLKPLARPGFYGRVPVELVLQDGVVDVVRVTGVEETIKIDRRAA